MKAFKALLIMIVCDISLGEYVDPHDMIGGGAKKKLNARFKKNEDLSDSANNEYLDNTIYHIHLKRIVSRLVNSAHIDKNDPDLYRGHLMFDITPTDLKFLTDFKDAEITLDLLRKLDTIVSESFSKTFIDEYLQEFTTLQVQLYSAIVNIQNLWLLGSCFMIYVVYQLFKTNFSFVYIVKYLIIVVFVIDFALRYQVLLEQAEEHNLNVQYSSICDTTKMSWKDYFTFLISSRDCERKAVTPLDAFLYQIKNVIVIPMHAFGSGLGGFGTQMYENTPWGLGLLFFPFMLLFSLALFIIMMAFVTSTTIELNFCHLFKIKFGSAGAENNKLIGRTVEKLIDSVFHRPMVQDVSVSNDNRSENKLRQSEKKVKCTEIARVQPKPSVDDNDLVIAGTSNCDSVTHKKENVEGDIETECEKSDSCDINVDLQKPSVCKDIGEEISKVNESVNVVDLK